VRIEAPPLAVVVDREGLVRPDAARIDLIARRGSYEYAENTTLPSS
jgi:hypothetical protein